MVRKKISLKRNRGLPNFQTFPDFKFDKQMSVLTCHYHGLVLKGKHYNCDNEQSFCSINGTENTSNTGRRQRGLTVLLPTPVGWLQTSHSCVCEETSNKGRSTWRNSLGNIFYLRSDIFVCLLVAATELQNLSPFYSQCFSSVLPINAISSVLPKFGKQSTNIQSKIHHLLLSSRIAQAVLSIRSITTKLKELFNINFLS